MSEPEASLLGVYLGCNDPEMHYKKVLGSPALCRFLKAAGILVSIRLEGLAPTGFKDEEIFPGLTLTTQLCEWSIEADDSIWKEVERGVWLNKQGRMFVDW